MSVSTSRRAPLAVVGLDYTGHITCVMRDVVTKVPALSFIDLDQVLVFARPGRTGVDGPNASCHCLTIPESEPGYFFWRDRDTGRLTRRSEWFVTKSPTVEHAGRRISYLISFSIPRFCDQTLARSRKRVFYSSDTPSWVSKLDTIVHELYHVDPSGIGLRAFPGTDGALHGPGYFEEVADMVQQYLAASPDPAVLSFLEDDFAATVAAHGAVAGLTFKPFPSYPRRYREVVQPQPPSPDLGDVRVEALVQAPPVTHFTDDDLQMRVFAPSTSRPLTPAEPAIAA